MCVCVCIVYNIHVKMNLPIRISKYTKWNEQKVTSRLIKCCQSLIVYNTKVAPSGMYKVPTVCVYESNSLIINTLWHIDNVRFYKRIFINYSSTVEKNTQNDVINLYRSRTKWNGHNKVIITDRYPEWEFLLFVNFASTHVWFFMSIWWPRMNNCCYSCGTVLYKYV